jgi:putative two-component system response regulator
MSNMKTIFAVDDSDSNLYLLSQALDTQYRVLTLPSAAKMFAILEKVTPDLILLDIEMPEMNGFEALERLKANNSYSGIPVVFLSGYIDDEIKARGLELGVADFVSKPFVIPTLLNSIEAQLSKQDK